MSRGKPNGTGRNGAKLTWAVGANGEITNIFEARNGLKCACTCPACGGALIAKQGKILEHHFAHAGGDECQHAVETALHLAAKNILAVRKELVLPAIKIPSRYTRSYMSSPPSMYQVLRESRSDGFQQRRAIIQGLMGSDMVVLMDPLRNHSLGFNE